MAGITLGNEGRRPCLRAGRAASKRHKCEWCPSIGVKHPAASATSNTLKAFNSALEYPEWINFDYSIYDPNQTQDAVFLTYFPTTSRALCGMQENFYLGYFEQSGVVPVLLNVFLLDIQGNTIASDSLSITSSDFNILNVGPQVIIANSSITQIDFDDCFKYEVAIDVSGVSFVGPFTIYMDIDCKRYETYRLHWLNKLGCWDSFTFALVSTQSATVGKVKLPAVPLNVNKPFAN